MDCIRIRGRQPLRGRIEIDGAKNAALPLMAASLLTDQPIALARYPELGDTRSMLALLRRLGVEAPPPGSCSRSITLVTRRVASTTADYDLVRRMRASVLVLGPLLARSGQAEISLPGGCAIGTTDFLLESLKLLFILSINPNSPNALNSVLFGDSIRLINFV